MKKLLVLMVILAMLIGCMTACSFMENFTFNGVVKDTIDDDDTPVIEIPTDPDDSDDSTNDGAPSTPPAPSEPSEPSEPSTPEEPQQPSTPSEPSEPSTPEDPSGPVYVTAEMDALEMAEYLGDTSKGAIMSDSAIMLDQNIKLEFQQGSAGTKPSFYEDAVRVYQKGGIIKITALNGKTIDQIIITTADSMDGGSGLVVTGGTASVDKYTHVITVTADEGATTVTIKASGESKSKDRIYVANIKVIYLGEAGDATTPEAPSTPSTPEEPEEPSTPEEPEEPSTPELPEEPEYEFNDFTAYEKGLYTDSIGLIIPFMPNNDYYVENYDEDGWVGVYFSALCEGQADFNAYKAQFSIYSYDGTDVDDYGDTMYLYSQGDVYIDIYYFEAGGDYYVEVDAYMESDSGSTGGDQEEESNVITNEGAGLPSGTNGVYNVDFTTATNVKDVTDQGYYVDGCPTVGSPKVLVIPVDFSDVTATSKGYSIDKIKNAFLKDGVTDYYSVYDYYYLSSYGKLTLDITVLDSWFRPSNVSTYYANATMDYSGQEVLIGDQMIMDEALKYLESKMDLSDFDSDGNDIIDAVVLVTTLEIDSDVDFYWAYRYWNVYTDDQDYYYEYDGVSANDYLWVPYQFLYEDYNGEDVNYDDATNMNTYTFIHEFGHVLGADDYYDTSYSGAPLDGYDVMDSMAGDHNAYSKFNYGWLTTSRLVVTDSSVTLTLEDFSKNGDTIILANNWDATLGAYQEYYVLVYYTNNGLNAGDYGYFDEEGLVVYHVNASLYSEDYEGETYYDVYNNNTDPSDEYGTFDNLIEYVSRAGSDYVYGVGDSLGTVTDDQGVNLKYGFTVTAMTADELTITFTKK